MSKKHLTDEELSAEIEALQAALEFSRHNYLALWLPVGQYKVTNTLRMAQHR